MSSIREHWNHLRNTLRLERDGMAHPTMVKSVDAREAFIRTCERSMDHHFDSIDEMHRLFLKVCKDTSNLDVYNQWVKYHNGTIV